MPADTVRRPEVLAETPAPRGPTRTLAPLWLAVSRTPGPSFTLFRMRKPKASSSLVEADGTCRLALLAASYAPFVIKAVGVTPTDRCCRDVLAVPVRFKEEMHTVGCNGSAGEHTPAGPASCGWLGQLS